MKICSSLAPLVLLLAAATSVVAQDSVSDKYLPLDHRQPTGMAGRWSVLTHPQKHGYMQPVEIKLPSTGEVQYYVGSPNNQATEASPSKVRMMVGHTYRVKISGMPEFPNVELYPTIEIIDRLHPPEGFVDYFPIPIEIASEEIEVVLQDRAVYKVIYLEQSDLAAPFDEEGGIRTEDVPPEENLLFAADQRGRPMAILRIGGLIPDTSSSVDAFYSTSPIQLETE